MCWLFCVDDIVQLHWPVLLVYPEHAQTDFIQEFEETCLFQDHLEVYAFNISKVYFETVKIEFLNFFFHCFHTRVCRESINKILFNLNYATGYIINLLTVVHVLFGAAFLILGHVSRRAGADCTLGFKQYL